MTKKSTKQGGAPAGDARGRILDAAVRLLEREGPRAFQQVRVAREAGLEQGHLTYYFPRKADLEVAVLAHIVERQQAVAFAFVSETSHDDPRARAIEFIKRRVVDRGATRLLLAFVLQLDESHASAKALEEVTRLQRASIAAIFGRDPADPRVEVAFAAIRGLALGQLVAPRSRKQIDAAVDEIVSWLYSGGGRA